MDESELYSEVVKTLRNVKSAEQLDWANPCANEVSENMFYFAGKRNRLYHLTVQNHCNPWLLLSQVYDRLYVGNGLSAKSVEYLKSLGITHLINSAHPDDAVPLQMKVDVDEDQLNDAGIKYLGLQLADDDDQDIR